MTKSEHGLSARSGATKRCTSRQEEELRWALAVGHITFARFEERYRELRKKGLVWRR